MKEISLSGSWRLYYHPENGGVPARLEDWASVEAQVPGNMELDLVRAGVEGDPFWDENIYHLSTEGKRQLIRFPKFDIAEATLIFFLPPQPISCFYLTINLLSTNVL